MTLSGDRAYNKHSPQWGTLQHQAYTYYQALVLSDAETEKKKNVKVENIKNLADLQTLY